MHRILVIEDNPDDVVLVQRAFHGESFKFEAVHSGEEAIKKLIHSPASTPHLPLPSLILVDLSLPGMDGFEVIRALKNHPPTASIPVVILTASDKEEDVVEGYQHGAMKIIRKPLTPLTVGEIMKECLEN